MGGEVTQENKSDRRRLEHFKDMSDVHNAALITEHTGADPFKMLLYECESAALGTVIHGIKNGIRHWIPQLLSQL